MTTWLGGLLWSVLGWIGVSSLSCGFWTGVSVGALERDPARVFATARGHLVAELTSTEAAAAWAVRLDRGGAASLRWFTGFPGDPAVEGQQVLETAKARVRDGWLEAVAHRDQITAASESTTASSATAGVVSALTRALIEPLVGRGVDASVAPARPSERALTALQRAEAAAAEAHITARRMLVRAVVWGLVLHGLGAVALTFSAAAVVAYRQTMPVVDPPLSLPLPPPRMAATTTSDPLPAPAATIADALEARLVPAAVARDLATWLSLAPRTPGSLRGHDRTVGGLLEHSLDVATRVNAETRTCSRRDQALYATLAAANDLGKVLSYKEDAFGSWSGHPSVPHDSLGAQMLALSPGVRRVFTEPEREDLLLALHCLHAPTLVPALARPRVRTLIERVKRADAAAAAAARAAAPASTASARV